jgi:choline transport protein
MTKLQTISASWVICDSWAGVAGTIALAISQGGPTTLVYGPILMFFLVGACALTLAELASVYPTAGGQYHWTSILAPRSINRSLVCTSFALFDLPYSYQMVPRATVAA